MHKPCKRCGDENGVFALSTTVWTRPCHGYVSPGTHAQTQPKVLRWWTDGRLNQIGQASKSLAFFQCLSAQWSRVYQPGWGSRDWHATALRSCATGHRQTNPTEYADHHRCYPGSDYGFNPDGDHYTTKQLSFEITRIHRREVRANDFTSMLHSGHRYKLQLRKVESDIAGMKANKDSDECWLTVMFRSPRCSISFLWQHNIRLMYRHTQVYLVYTCKFTLCWAALRKHCTTWVCKTTRLQNAGLKHVYWMQFQSLTTHCWLKNLYVASALTCQKRSTVSIGMHCGELWTCMACRPIWFGCYRCTFASWGQVVGQTKVSPEYKDVYWLLFRFRHCCCQR